MARRGTYTLHPDAPFLSCPEYTQWLLILGRRESPGVCTSVQIVGDPQVRSRRHQRNDPLAPVEVVQAFHQKAAVPILTLTSMFSTDALRGDVGSPSSQTSGWPQWYLPRGLQPYLDQSTPIATRVAPFPPPVCSPPAETNNLSSENGSRRLAVAASEASDTSTDIR